MAEHSKCVGVVIPIYNVENYLRECLDSVLAQTYTNMQIVLVNDGSTDSSMDIALEYAARDPRFIIFEKRNGCQGTARNVGIEYFSSEYAFRPCQDLDGCDLYNIEGGVATYDVVGYNPHGIYKVYKSSDAALSLEGAPEIDYIIFLDSDDYWDKECIQECVNHMDGVEVVQFDFKMFTDEKNMTNPNWNRLKRYKNDGIISSHEWRENVIATYPLVCDAMIDFAHLRKIGLKFINNIIHEDHHFGTLLLLQIERLYVLRKVFYNYRVRPNSTCNFDKKINLENIPVNFHYLNDYFNNPANTKKYLEAYSWINIISELNKFADSSTEEVKELLLKKIIPAVIHRTSFIYHSAEDPMELGEKIFNNPDLCRLIIRITCKKRFFTAAILGEMIIQNVNRKFGKLLLPLRVTRLVKSAFNQAELIRDDTESGS